MERNPCVYMLASDRNGTLYTGVTSHLLKRVWEHRNHVVPGFTQRYAVSRLVWFELHGTMEAAIYREKCIKKWRRQWKLDLVDASNSSWRDLWPDIAARTPMARSMDSRVRGNDEQELTQSA